MPCASLWSGSRGGAAQDAFLDYVRLPLDADGTANIGGSGCRYMGALEYVPPGAPPPTVFEPKAAVPKKGADTCRDITNARDSGKATSRQSRGHWSTSRRTTWPTRPLLWPSSTATRIRQGREPHLALLRMYGRARLGLGRDRVLLGLSWAVCVL